MKDAGPRRTNIEEPFVLNGMLSLVVGTVWLVHRPELLLQYFYFDQLLALTHVFTLGFLSSLMMGVLHRLSPTFLGIEASSRRVSRAQLVFFVVGSWGMIAHFWLGEPKGMSWATFLVFGAGVLQLWNFRGLFRGSRKNVWVRRFVAASLVYFPLAAFVGILLGLLKGYDVRSPGLANDYMQNVFAHAHLAAIGWVLMMIFGVELKLVPTTVGNPRSLPLRFLLLHLGTLGLAFTFLTGTSVAPFAVILAVAFVWHALGPARFFLSGKTGEWELLPLLLLIIAAGCGIVLSLGWPEPADPARGRLQLAYGFLGIVGFMVLTVVSVAFKLFPMWVWQERFQSEFGKRPVPGMKELHSEKLRVAANVGLFAAVVGTALGIYLGSETVVAVTTKMLLIGVVCFVANFVRVARWELLKKEYEPTEADWAKFKTMFPKASS